MRKTMSKKIEEGGDRETKNLHTFRHYHLKVACLPIPPYARPLHNEASRGGARKVILNFEGGATVFNCPKSAASRARATGARN